MQAIDHFLWYALNISEMEGTCPIVTRAHYTEGGGEPGALTLKPGMA